MYMYSIERPPDLFPGHLYLVLAARPVGRTLMNTFAARLALAGPLRERFRCSADRPPGTPQNGNAGDSLGPLAGGTRFYLLPDGRHAGATTRQRPPTVGAGSAGDLLR